MVDSIDGLKDAAVRKARESGSLEDLEKAVSICKMAAEAQKGSAEAATQKSVVRQEGLKNWAQLLVPLLSVLTLAVTMLTQTQQQKELERNRQDTQWRTTIDAFNGAYNSKAPIGGLLAQVKLKPYLKSPDYGDQANQLARLVLPLIADPDGFRDLFESVKWDNLTEMVAVERSLNGLYDETTRQLTSLSDAKTAAGLHSPGAGIQTLRTGALPSPTPPVDIPSREDRLKADQGLIISEISYVCERIGEESRSERLGWVKPGLDKTWFFNCDLSKVDFSDAVLNDAIFQNVNLNDARFSGITKIDNVSVSDTAWWKASDISAPLLKVLMEQSDPGSDLEKNLGDQPTRDEYVKQVTRLCKTANLSCAVEKIKFTTPSSPSKGQ